VHATSSSVVLTYIQINGPNLVDIWIWLGNNCAIFHLHRAPYATIFQKVFGALLIWITR